MKREHGRLIRLWEGVIQYIPSLPFLLLLYPKLFILAVLTMARPFRMVPALDTTLFVTIGMAGFFMNDGIVAHRGRTLRQKELLYWPAATWTLIGAWMKWHKQKSVAS